MITRRQFLQATAALALVPMLPHDTIGATSLHTRPSWPTFRKSTSYPAFLRAVGAMRANKNSTSPASWAYWTSVHGTFCPHHKPYFLAWHRGFLARFEAQLRKAAGSSSLVLPYWDYYYDPILPTEFQDPSSPLYLAGRTGKDVSGALSMTPFGNSLINLPRGYPYAFEPAVETAPHNPVHNLIGGAMDNVAISPRDPIFWLHHANIDRLWDAWVRAGAGRHMPSKTSSYWSGSFNYGAAVSGVARLTTYAPSNLGYRYDNSTLPTGGYGYGMQAAASAQLPAIQDAFAQPLPAQGPSLGGVGGLALGPRSTRIRIPLSADGRDRVRSLVTRAPQATSGSALQIVLDGVDVTGAGTRGGYFYKLLLNLPSGGLAQPEQTYLVGTLGPFEVSVARHAKAMAMGAGGHMAMQGPARITLPALDVLSRIWPAPLDALTLSFVRVDAGRPQAADAMTIERLWFEAAA
ncbi:Common central domain of tyrosinase [Frateuria terrea]|uniref:Common central domain of tyrosinase n=2 Tax=Frateuria terrea TaxID=529704 RepID=A0A1H6UN47_9GAMM|nr:Common central domain of tyrosinase [Frateuria terrea]SFP34579.1 Common central domain of tyrosinase [Frateuria terrea]